MQAQLDITITDADFEDPEHQRAIVALLDSYAQDAMGLRRGLPESVRRELIPGLRSHPTSCVFLARHGNESIGIAVCFVGFSTFAARPLINIHDLAVLPDYRGQGVGRRLLERVEEKALELGCCKLTLEVREDNERAHSLYRDVGFGGGATGRNGERFLFLEKRLP